MEDEVGEPKVNKHGSKGVKEEAVSRCAIDLLERTQYGNVVFLVECRVQRDCDQRRRPQTVRWVDEELSGQTSETVSDEVRRETDKDLVAKASGILLVELEGQDLSPDDVLSVRQTLSHSGHQGDEHMLLLVESTRVETVLNAEKSKAPVWYDLLPGLTKREGKQLGDVRSDTDGWVADREQLVDCSESNREEDANRPCTNRRARGVDIIDVIDNTTDLGVWRVVSDECSLQLHFPNKLLVFLGVLEDVRGSFTTISSLPLNRRHLTYPETR